MKKSQFQSGSPLQVLSSFNYDFPKSYEEAQSEFDSSFDSFNSAMNWAIVASIITAVVGAAAMVAVVYFLIDCLKRAGTAIPNYARIATGDLEKSLQAIHSSPAGVISLAPSSISTEHNQELLDEFTNLMPRRFSLEELPSITNNYEELLGSGGYGDVYKGKLPDGTPVAVKLLRNADDSGTRKQFVEEVISIGTTHHINLVKLYGYCLGPPWRALVYEYMEKKSLDMFLLGEEDIKEIDWPRMHKIAVGAAKGIAYLHEECEPKIVHCDIKPGNILLDGNFSPKVADFGLAKLCKDGRISISGFRGTSNYAAPEMQEPNSVTYKCDVYSFGMLLLEIMERRRDHNANQSEPLSTLARQTWHMQQNNELSEMICWVPVTEREKAEDMLTVALLCVQHMPEARPEMSDVVKMLEGEKTFRRLKIRSSNSDRVPEMEDSPASKP
ncbi:rust resistance kinase Lr10-like [Rhodamnia argentea]|uniref:Rust resistance kinase Lr10-like n=1 Tax=Rhodamnia argentea TaxID=178133 RepID=A0ABM3H8T8_9MYRT|nr:rust resistance kinase Lr10-like [Rhodamnia argentea]